MALNRDKVLRDAEKLVQKGKIEQAIREYEKLLKLNPNDANTINRVGDLYGRIGEVEKAIELYERIADHFTQDGFTTKAIAILKKINRLAPQRLDIFERLSDLYIQQGLTVEAKSQLEILADWYAKNDEMDRAVATHRKLLDLDPSNHVAHLRLADLLLQLGDSVEAIGEYDRLGQVLIQRGKLDEAERLYRHALEQDPPSCEFMTPICSALLDAGRTTVAREFLDIALKISPDLKELAGLDVQCRIQLGDSDDALKRAEELLEADSDNDEMRLLAGKALLSMGEAVRARDHLLPAAERLLEAGDYAAAQSVLQDLVQATPKDPEVLARALQAFEPSGNEEMLFTLRAALAEAQYRAGRQDVARRLYVELLEKEPSNERFRQRLAQLDQGGAVVDEPDDDFDIVDITKADLQPKTAATGDTEGREVAADAPPPFNPAERLAEANVFAKYGLLDKAANHLEEIVRHFPDHLEASEKLVALLVEKGDQDRAAAVAEPLMTQLEANGEGERLTELRTMLGGQDVSSSTVAEEDAVVETIEVSYQGEESDEDVVIIDVDDVGEAVASPEEPVVEIDDSFADDDEVVIEFDVDEFEAEAAVQESVQEDDDEFAVVHIEAIEDEGPTAEVEPVAEVVEIEAEKEPVIAEVASPPMEEESALDADAEILVIGEDDEMEDLVDFTGTVAGPSPSDLDQLDFFIAQELGEDALRLLGRLEAEHPGDSEIVARHTKLKAMGLLFEEVAVTAEPSEVLFAEEDEFIDLAQELESEIAEEDALVEEATGRGQEEALLEEVFKEFQKGVAEQLSEEDSDTHFNLGIAYKEMGLLPEAVREFQISARDPRYFVECCSMIGVCYLEQGMASQAAEWYGKALTTDGLSPEATLALRYDMASALEQAGESTQAHGMFEEIAENQPDYRDVSTRLVSLDSERHVN
ncbi:MAG: tetratricopeptide repeat protein [bacterium]|nr:tetratricopeptide repeat protein [bacterium]